MLPSCRFRRRFRCRCRCRFLLFSILAPLDGPLVWSTAFFRFQYAFNMFSSHSRTLDVFPAPRSLRGGRFHCGFRCSFRHFFFLVCLHRFCQQLMFENDKKTTLLFSKPTKSRGVWTSVSSIVSQPTECSIKSSPAWQLLAWMWRIWAVCWPTAAQRMGRRLKRRRTRSATMCLNLCGKGIPHACVGGLHAIAKIWPSAI